MCLSFLCISSQRLTVGPRVECNIIIESTCRKLVLRDEAVPFVISASLLRSSHSARPLHGLDSPGARTAL